MLRVGLTGSIGVGKSYVTALLGKLGSHTLDADVVAREVVAPDGPGLAAVVQHFGPETLSLDGTLDRKKLGAIVFNDPEKRQLLNSILHPFIIARQDEILREWASEDPNGIAIVDAALMIESGGYQRFDKLIVVHCAPEVQLKRLMDRDGFTREEAERRVAAQMSQEDKLRFADFSIDTTEGFEATRKQVEAVYEQLQQLAKIRNPK